MTTRFFARDHVAQPFAPRLVACTCLACLIALGACSNPMQSSRQGLFTNNESIYTGPADTSIQGLSGGNLLY